MSCDLASLRSASAGDTGFPGRPEGDAVVFENTSRRPTQRNAVGTGLRRARSRRAMRNAG
jgi:hypothetical protein